MNLRFLEYFQVLARHQHYARAAEELGIAQSSLSHAIGCLEGELDAELFEKQGRNIVLTHRGAQYLQYVDAALQLLEDGRTQLQRNADGIIAIGFVSSVRTYLLKAMEEFQKEPEYRDCQFLLYEGATDALIQDLQKGKVHFVAASQAGSDVGVRSTILLEQKLYVIDSVEKPLFSREKLEIEDLSGKPMILHTPTSGMRPIIDGLFDMYHCRPLIVGEASEDAVIAQMVSMGVGAALVTDSEEIRQIPGIRMIPLDIRENYRYIYLTRKKGRILPEIVEAFIGTLGARPERKEQS